MVDAVNERAAVERARNAELVLSNPAFIEAMARMESDIVGALKTNPVDDEEKALLLSRLLRMTSIFSGHLCGMLEAGKLSQSKINIESERNESRTQRFLRKFA